MHTDEKLAAQGTRKAFEELYARYRGPVHQFLRRQVRDASRAEDLFQTVFFKVFRSLASFRGESSFKTWIFTVAYRCVLDHRRSPGVCEELRQDVAAPPAPDTTDVAEQIDRIKRALDAVPPPHKTLFLLVRYHGMRIADARKLVKRMIESLAGGTILVMGHHMTLQTMGEPGAKERAIEFLSTLTTGGACDLERAVPIAMRAAPDGGEVVYVGEGAPTIGETDVAKIIASAREACAGKIVTFRAVAVGSDADRATLGAIAAAFHGGVHAIHPNDDVDRRVEEIARTLGRPALQDVKVTFEGEVSDVAPAAIGGLYFGERAIVTARYTGGRAKAIVSGRVQGREIRREFPLELPPQEKRHLFVKRLWAQRRLADLLARGEAARAEVTALGVSHQLMTPYTSFLVLENERAYQEHAIERTKKEQEELVAGRARSMLQQGDGRRESVEKTADLFELAFVAAEQRDLDRVLQYGNQILTLDPRNLAARQMIGDAKKGGARPQYYRHLRRIENQKVLAGVSFDEEELLEELDRESVDIINHPPIPPIAGLDTPGVNLTPKVELLTIGGGTALTGATFALEEPIDPRFVSNEPSYIESYDIQAAGAAVVLDPVPDVVTDGNTLSVRPVAERTRLLEVRRALQNRGIDTSRVAPVRPLQGQVTAVSSEIGLVVISIGRDDGVIEGGELSVFRGDQFVAKITIDRIDSRWSAGRITLKGQAGDPRVGDRVSNTTIEEPPELHPLRDIVANTGWGPRLLANLIRTHIAPGTWTGEHTIDVTPHDHLLVHHTAETQAAVRAFLERLRQNPQLVFDLREFQRLRAMGGTR